MKKEEKNSVLIVDDESANIVTLMHILTPEYTVYATSEGQKTVEIAEKSLPDVILLDVIMPDMDGYEVIAALKKNKKTRDIPVIFITGLTSSEAEEIGLNLGAVDYIPKPFHSAIVMLRIANQMKIVNNTRALSVSEGKLRVYNEHLEDLVEEKVKEIYASRVATIHALVKSAEARDDDTGAHIERTSAYCKLIAEKAYEIGAYRSLMSEDYPEILAKASPLHDIGKVGIPDAILLKPARLTDKEFEIMKAHVSIGYEMLASVEKSCPENAYLKLGMQIAKHHHERWDGTGYLDGLAGDDIPLSARIMALSDVYDALRSKRVYKESFSHAKAVEIIAEGRGTHYDPVLVDVFMQHHLLFNEIFDRLTDGRDAAGLEKYAS